MIMAERNAYQNLTKKSETSILSRTSQGHRCFSIMGILNVTPDSFYDGDRYRSIHRATDRAHEMIEEGADIVDVGGESTRPGALGISEEEEIRRVIPVIERLAKETPVTLSVDTTKAEVARRAIDAGATMVNDVSGFQMDQRMADVIAGSGVRTVLTHMRGVPRDMQKQPKYENVTQEVYRFFKAQVSWAVSKGVAFDRFILDPGIGFGKTVVHNLELLRSLDSFSDLEMPLLIGLSRKSFIGKIQQDAGPQERLSGSLAAAVIAYLHGVRFFRVHDVLETKKALTIASAIREGHG